MEKLKITLGLASGVIIDRLTTIDSILLSCYYDFMQKKGKRLAFDPEHKSVEFIHRKKGIFSGSIWYVEESAEVHHDFMTIVKTPEYRKIFNYTKGKSNTNSKIKQAQVSNEIMLTKEVYFYIKADKNIVKAILEEELKSIGRFAGIGYGQVLFNKVEIVEDDKGFMLDESTPSKPLPVSEYTINSKKIAFSRRIAPYWLNDNLEACYMPTTCLYEVRDNSFRDREFVVSDNLDFISNTKFLHDSIIENKNNSYTLKNTDFSNTTIHKKFNYHYVDDNKDKKCAFSGEISNCGISNDARQYLIKSKPSFSDFGYMKNNDFISKETLWCIDNLSTIAYLYVGNNEQFYLQGKLAEDGKRINDCVRDLSILSAPFSINLKDTANAQHISFKGKVSLSNAYFIVQYGDTTLNIDAELLKRAIKDIDEITCENKEITKTHLCRNFLKFFEIKLKEKNTIVNEKIIVQFQKKYNRDIRNLLSVLNISQNK